jgi:glycosyltransferase involved in cell wall biosynthesis
VKVLHIYKDYPPIFGGMENHIKVLAESQATRGHAVTVLVTNPAGAQTTINTENGVRVVRASRLATVASTPLSLAMPRWLVHERPDVTHLHFPYPFGDVAHALFGRARRTVITYHSDIVRQKSLLRLYAPLLRRSLARADRIIATSPNYITTSPFLAPQADKCTVVPLGIDVARFAVADPAQVAQIRARYGDPLILFVGRLRYYKGVEYLIRAMPQLPGRALIIGGEATTRLAELEQIAQSAGVGDRVLFLGATDAELPAFYHACDVFVLPAIERSEAFGLVLIEAMAAGKPVVCTELGTGTTYVNQDGVTGLVAPPRDSIALAAAINRLLADADLRQRFGQAAQERAQREFSDQIMVERVMQVYQLVLSC